MNPTSSDYSDADIRCRRSGSLVHAHTASAAASFIPSCRELLSLARTALRLPIMILVLGLIATLMSRLHSSPASPRSVKSLQPSSLRRRRSILHLLLLDSADVLVSLLLIPLWTLLRTNRTNQRSLPLRATGFLFPQKTMMAPRCRLALLPLAPILAGMPPRGLT